MKYRVDKQFSIVIYLVSTKVKYLYAQAEAPASHLTANHAVWFAIIEHDLMHMPFRFFMTKVDGVHTYLRLLGAGSHELTPFYFFILRTYCIRFS